MATTVEITPVIRQATCGPDGSARLIFLVTNIQERTADIIVGIAQDQGIDANWFDIEDGADRTLAPKPTARIIVIAKLPPGTAPGHYKFRLEVEEDTLCDYGLGSTGVRALGQRGQNMYDE